MEPGCFPALNAAEIFIDERCCTTILIVKYNAADKYHE